VSAVKGLVTAKGPSGFRIRSTTLDSDPTSSNSIYVFGSSAGKNLTVGDIITLEATVSEYRSSPTYLCLTELTAPKNIKLISTGNQVTPKVIGEGSKSPPTEQFTSLDKGDILGLPKNASQFSIQNPSLRPQLYGLDFWESMSGKLVMVQKPTAIAKPNTYGDTWVVGSWNTSGRNSRGGLTLTDRGKILLFGWVGNHVLT
jgi:predicted extracellular nuclease